MELELVEVISANAEPGDVGETEPSKGGQVRLKRGLLRQVKQLNQECGGERREFIYA